jgi:hypothetical protein
MCFLQPGAMLCLRTKSYPTGSPKSPSGWSMISPTTRPRTVGVVLSSAQIPRSSQLLHHILCSPPGGVQEHNISWYTSLTWHVLPRLCLTLYSGFSSRQRADQRSGWRLQARRIRRRDRAHLRQIRPTQQLHVRTTIDAQLRAIVGAALVADGPVGGVITGPDEDGLYGEGPRRRAQVGVMEPLCRTLCGEHHLHR